MSKKLYRLTDQANVELRRIAVDGKVALTERGARHEIARGTVQADAKLVLPVKSAD